MLAELTFRFRSNGVSDWTGFEEINVKKQPPRGVPGKRCSENMQQIYRRTPMPKCDFNKVAKHPVIKSNTWIPIYITQKANQQYEHIFQ